MTVMGLSSDIQQHVLHIVAGVLHLGNIEFVEKNNCADIANRQCPFTYHSRLASPHRISTDLISSVIGRSHGKLGRFTEHDPVQFSAL